MNKGTNLTEKQKKEIIDKYSQKMALAKIAQEYKCSTNKIKTVLQEKGVAFTSRKNISKYNFNQKWLDKLDCAEKFYFLGFMFSDGNNCSKYNTSSITLQECDKEILLKFSELLQNDRPLYYNSKTKSYTLRFCSKYFCERLDELGCIPKKSLVLKFPTYVPTEYLKDFIRGYFDGDGGLSLNNKGNTIKADVTFAGTLCFNNEILKILNLELGISDVKIYSYDTTKCTKLLITTQFSSLVFLDWIYKDSVIYLSRKYNKYKTLKESRGKMKSNPSMSRKILKDKEDYIIQQHLKGISNSELGRQLNVNKTTIGRFLKRKGY